MYNQFIFYITMDSEKDMVKWWASLSIVAKESLSGKNYPECSEWWNSLTLSEKVEAKETSGIERSKRNKSKGFT